MHSRTLCCLLIAVCISFVAANDKIKEIGDKAEKVCSEKYNTTEQEVRENAKAGNATETDYCYTGCTMLEEGVITEDGQFDKESTDAVLADVEDDMQREGMRGFMYLLGKELVEATDICSAGEIGLSFMTKSQI